MCGLYLMRVLWRDVAVREGEGCGRGQRVGLGVIKAGWHMVQLAVKE